MKLNNRRTQNKSAKRRQRQHKKSAKGKNLRKKKQTKRRTKMGGGCKECIRTWENWYKLKVPNGRDDRLMQAYDMLHSADFQYDPSAFGCNPECQKPLLAHLTENYGNPYNRDY